MTVLNTVTFFGYEIDWVSQYTITKFSAGQWSQRSVHTRAQCRHVYLNVERVELLWIVCEQRKVSINKILHCEAPASLNQPSGMISVTSITSCVQTHIYEQLNTGRLRATSGKEHGSVDVTYWSVISGRRLLSDTTRVCCGRP